MASGERENRWPGRRVLVTGGGGFIGSALVWELNGRGCTDIVIADSAPEAERSRYLRHLIFAGYIEPERTLSWLAAGPLGEFDLAFRLGGCSFTTEIDRKYLYR